jgi:hypothetical protein
MMNTTGPSPSSRVGCARPTCVAAQRAYSPSSMPCTHGPSASRSRRASSPPSVRIRACLLAPRPVATAHPSPGLPRSLAPVPKAPVPRDDRSWRRPASCGTRVVSTPSGTRSPPRGTRPSPRTRGPPRTPESPATVLGAITSSDEAIRWRAGGFVRCGARWEHYCQLGRNQVSEESGTPGV